MSPLERKRVHLEVRGAVQGVGFRPYVFRLAEELELSGWVTNDTRGVTLEVEGDRRRVVAFLRRFPAELPPRAIVHQMERSWVELDGRPEFVIRESGEAGAKSAVLLPDVAACRDCLAEVFDPEDRRHLYPFTNCTNCGPRFSIIEGLPYDRPRTTMAGFEMCPACAAEYGDPRDRRFHAQPNACPACGPRLWLEKGEERRIDGTVEALAGAAEALRAGYVVAVKGLGGFHLMVDARDESAVARLRKRKARYAKPLALMVRDLAAARRLCAVDGLAAEALASATAPIVLLPRRPDAEVAASVAPGNPYLGVMLPYTPLHHLLLSMVEFSLVATSGNLSDEPICTDNDEARERLGEVADLFLLHDRPIARHVDDSVVTCFEGATIPIRRARGLAPLPVLAGRPAFDETAGEVLAVGAHQKNTVALTVGRRVFLSQHVGDMETPQAFAAFEQVIGDFLAMYDARPRRIAHDLHPDYLSTRWAREAVEPEPDGIPALAGAELVPVQHHHAHLASCLAEHGFDGRALGVVWDGTGLGTDGTIWGGEFLLGDAREFERAACLRPFRLPGGEAAVREPRRMALALLWEIFGDAALERLPTGVFAPEEAALLATMLSTGLRSPVTTSAGRLFDGIAALAGLRCVVSFEGQAAMELEFVAAPEVDDAYPIDVGSGPGESTLELDWRPLVEAAAEDSRRGVPAGTISARFHGALAEGIRRVARQVGEPTVALSGGCFQNRLLTELCYRRLRRDGFEVLIHRRVPPNDGGISLGQAAVAAARQPRTGGA